MRARIGGPTSLDVPEARGVPPEAPHGAAPEEKAEDETPARGVPDLVVEALACRAVLRGEQLSHRTLPVRQGEDEAAEEMEIPLEAAGVHHSRLERARLPVPPLSALRAEAGAKDRRVHAGSPRTARVRGPRLVRAEEAHEVGGGQLREGGGLQLDERELGRVHVDRQDALAGRRARIEKVLSPPEAIDRQRASARGASASATTAASSQQLA